MKGAKGERVHTSVSGDLRRSAYDAKRILRSAKWCSDKPMGSAGPGSDVAREAASVQRAGVDGDRVTAGTGGMMGKHLRHYERQPVYELRERANGWECRIQGHRGTLCVSPTPEEAVRRMQAYRTRFQDFCRHMDGICDPFACEHCNEGKLTRGVLIRDA